MVPSHRARVLVIDNDVRVRQDLPEMLDPALYTVEVALGEGQALIDGAQKLAERFRPHVAIVDLRLLDEYCDDRSGLELIQSLGSARCILYSSYLTSELTLVALKKYKAAGWVDKSDDPQRLIDEIAEQSQECCAGRRDVTVRGGDQILQQISRTLLRSGAAASPGIVEDILVQLFPHDTTIILETLQGNVSTPDTFSSVGRGRSAILKVWQEGRLAPVVVKLALAQRIDTEAQNYQQYISRNLGGRFHAMLENPPVIFWDLGGLLYSFLDMPGDPQGLRSFASFYCGQDNVQTIVRPLRHFFGEVWSDLYKSKSKQTRTLFESYDTALHSLHKRLRGFDSHDALMRFPGIPDPLPNPVDWVLCHADDSEVHNTSQAITHGDLHGDNLFVDGTHGWVIDFERSGPGPILRDFIELEVDIVTRLTDLPADNPRLLYDLAVVLTDMASPTAPFHPPACLKQHEETRKALGVIAELRKIAHEVTAYKESREYLWGLLLDAVFVAALVPPGAPQRERALLLGAVLCQRLRR